MTMVESEGFPKLLTDSETLTLSESFVKSDIANIIQKIYSPRPPVHFNSSFDSTTKARNNIGDNITICRQKRKEEKRFGFYFEPVTRSFAKTIVDSSTTSGSVSMPIVRYKPKRLRQVCDCCKRKIPYRDHETRAKQACGDCRIFKRNYCSQVDHSAAAGDGLQKEETPWGQYSKTKFSDSDIARVHPKCSNLKFLEETREEFTNLERKRSSTNLQGKHSGNVSKGKLGNTQDELNCGSAMTFRVVSALSGDNGVDKKRQLPTQRVKKLQEKNVSFLQRVVSNLLGKKTSASLLEERARPGSRKTGNFRCTPKKSSKISMKEAKEMKNRRDHESLENQEKHISSVSIENSRRDRVSKSNEVTEKSAEVDLEYNHISCQTINSEYYDTNLRKVIIHSCPELSNHGSKPKVDNKSSNEDRNGRDYMNGKDLESMFSKQNEQNRPTSEKTHDKYQVAYKGLRIERDADWAYEFWGEIFGACHSVVSFFTAFLLHLLTFLLQSVIQPLFFGTVRVSSDHFFKPCLSTAFESVIQPVCVLVERSMLSLRDVCFPVAQCFGTYCKELSHVCNACRVVEIHKSYHYNEEPLNP